MTQTSDRDANRALQARFERVYGEYTRVRAGLGELQEQLAGLQARASSPDGLVSAVVGPRGHLLRLDLDPKVYRTHEVSALAATITETVRQATAKAADEAATLVSGYLPAGTAGMAFLRDNDFGALLNRYDGESADGRPDER